MENKNLKEFLAISSHKIKSPLASIKALIVIGKKNKRQQILEKIEEKINLVNYRVDNFFEALFLIEKKTDLFFEFFDLKKSLIQLKQNNKNIELNVVEFELMADKEKLEKAFFYFLKLARLNSTGKIIMSLKTKEKKARIIIQSTNNNENKILEVENDLKTELFIAEKIIEAHGGSYKKREKDKKIFQEVEVPKKPKKLILG